MSDTNQICEKIYSAHNGQPSFNEWIERLQAIPVKGYKNAFEWLSEHKEEYAEYLEPKERQWIYHTKK